MSTIVKLDHDTATMEDVERAKRLMLGKVIRMAHPIGASNRDPFVCAVIQPTPDGRTDQPRKYAVYASREHADDNEGWMLVLYGDAFWEIYEE